MLIPTELCVGNILLVLINFFIMKVIEIYGFLRKLNYSKVYNVVK